MDSNMITALAATVGVCLTGIGCAWALIRCGWKAYGGIITHMTKHEQIVAGMLAELKEVKDGLKENREALANQGKLLANQDKIIAVIQKQLEFLFSWAKGEARE